MFYVIFEPDVGIIDTNDTQVAFWFYYWEILQMKAIWQNKIIAESNDTVVVENNHYFPKAALNADYFESSPHTTVCPWKGTASYYSVVVDGETNKDAAWYYSDPKPDAEKIRDRVAFWRGVQITE